MPGIDPDDPRPPYLQIADDLRRAITDGRYRPGQRMESTRELAAVYGVAAMTVHQAMRVLRDSGLVISHQGRGVFVRAEGDIDQVGRIDGQEPGDILRAIGGLERRLDELRDGLGGEVAELRGQLGEVRAQLIDLYARTGQPYPREQSGSGRAAGQRRRASGS